MIINLQFPSVNVSCQVGDIVYFAKTVSGTSGINHHNAGAVDTKVKVFGACVAVTATVVTVDTSKSGGTGSGTGDVEGAVFMFQKDKNAGLSGITGYYALTEYRNYATVPAEMFATAVDYVESSK